MHRAIILPFLLATAPLGAVEVADLRLSLGVGPLPTERSGTFTNVPTPSPPITQGAAYRERYESSPGLSIVLGGSYGTLAPAGLLWGLEFRHVDGTLTLSSFQMHTVTMSPSDLSAFSGDSSIPTIKYSQNGFAATFGGGLALSEQLHLELVAIAGLDAISFEGLANLAGPLQTQNGKGFGQTYGGRLGLYWTSESNWQLGIEGEWTNTHGKVRVSYLDVDTESSFNNDGFSARASVGYRF